VAELGGGAEGAVALPSNSLADKGGKQYQMPHHFADLSGMMPASMEKTWAYIGENV